VTFRDREISTYAPTIPSITHQSDTQKFQDAYLPAVVCGMSFKSQNDWPFPGCRYTTLKMQHSIYQKSWQTTQSMVLKRLLESQRPNAKAGIDICNYLELNAWK